MDGEKWLLVLSYHIDPFSMVIELVFVAHRFIFEPLRKQRKINSIGQIIEGLIGNLSYKA